MIGGKHGRALAVIAAVLRILLFAGTAEGQVVTDRAVYLPPNYDTFLPPPIGSAYQDPVFHSAIKRVSDATGTHDDARGDVNLAFAGTEYSTMTPFNQDNSRFLLQHASYYGLYDATGRFLKNLPFEVNSGSEPRWSRTAPNVLYYHVLNQLRRLDTDTNSVSILHTFSEFTYIGASGESDICFDGNHLVLWGDQRWIFVYDISTDTKGGALDTGEYEFNSLYITPDDHVLIYWVSQGLHAGIEMFDKDLNFIRRVAPVGGHMDVTRDTNGDEVLLWSNSADIKPICDNGIIKIRLSDASQTCLVTFDWSLALHVSATDNSGWFFVETYAPDNPKPSVFWPAYTNEILQVKMDGSEVRRIAHHRSRPYNNYNYTPRVTSSRDGSRILYTSNYGLPTLVETRVAAAAGLPSLTDPLLGRKMTQIDPVLLPVLQPLLTALGSSLETLLGYTNTEYTDVFFVQLDPRTAGTAIKGRVDPPGSAAVSIGSGGGGIWNASQNGALKAVYGRIATVAGTRAYSGIAIFSRRVDGVLVSEAAVPARPLIASARVFARIDSKVTTVVAIANPSSQPAAITFSFVDASGVQGAQGSLAIAPGQQIARFINESPFNGSSGFEGSLTLLSSTPVALTALTGFYNERSEFLMSSLDVVDLDASAGTSPSVIPHFANGGGWTTDIELVNPTLQAISGSVAFMGQVGQILGSAQYSIASRGAKRVLMPSAVPADSGSVRIIPDPGSVTPLAMARLAFKFIDTTTTVMGISASQGPAFRTYVEASPGVESGVAMANDSEVVALVNLQLTNLNGEIQRTAQRTILPHGHDSQSLSELFPDVQQPISGVLRIAGDGHSLGVVSLRWRYNTRGDFVAVTMAPVSEQAIGARELFLPHIVAGEGYSTQIILINGESTPFQGTLQLFEQNGSPAAVPSTAH